MVKKHQKARKRLRAAKAKKGETLILSLTFMFDISVTQITSEMQ